MYNAPEDEPVPKGRQNIHHALSLIPTGSRWLRVLLAAARRRGLPLCDGRHRLPPSPQQAICARWPCLALADAASFSGHLAGRDTVEHVDPNTGGIRSGKVRGEIVEANSALLCGAVVAIQAVLLQIRLERSGHAFAERCCAQQECCQNKAGEIKAHAAAIMAQSRQITKPASSWRKLLACETSGAALDRRYESCRLLHVRNDIVSKLRAPNLRRPFHLPREIIRHLL